MDLAFYLRPEGAFARMIRFWRGPVDWTLNGPWIVPTDTLELVSPENETDRVAVNHDLIGKES